MECRTWMICLERERLIQELDETRELLRKERRRKKRLRRMLKKVKAMENQLCAVIDGLRSDLKRTAAERDIARTQLLRAAEQLVIMLDPIRRKP